MIEKKEMIQKILLKLSNKSIWEDNPNDSVEGGDYWISLWEVRRVLDDFYEEIKRDCWKDGFVEGMKLKTETIEHINGLLGMFLKNELEEAKT